MIIQPENKPIKNKWYLNTNPYCCLIEPFTVPAGFEYDLASVPWIAQKFVFSDGLIRGPALCHDYLYRHKGKVPRNDNEEMTEYSRKQADRIFKNLMLAAGMKKWRVDLAYSGVRAFGGFRAW